MKSFRTLNWKYAIGELLIVFVGIMSAVEVDRWNSRRGERATRQAYLDRIVVDLEADLAFLDEAEQAAGELSEAVDRFLLFMSSDRSAPPDSAVAAGFRDVITSGRVDNAIGLRSGTFRDMMSTGALALVEDPELRDALIEYYEVVTVPGLNYAIEYQGSLGSPLQELFAVHLDYRVLYGSLRDRPGSRLFVTDWQSLRGDPELRTQLQRLSAGAFSIAGFYPRIAEDTRRLRDLVATGN